LPLFPFLTSAFHQYLLYLFYEDELIFDPRTTSVSQCRTFLATY
jgi:hypothetical protein